MPTVANSPYIDLHQDVEEPENRSRCAAPDIDPDLFDPRTQAEYDQALAVCRSCPRRQECKQDARDGKESGVWGGAFFDSGRQRNPSFRKVGLRAGLKSKRVQPVVSSTPESLAEVQELSPFSPQFQPTSTGPLGRLYTQQEFDALMGRQPA